MSHTSAAARPRLLFLAQTLPFPPDGGVNIRTYNILRLLSREFDVTALCFYRQRTHPSPERVAAAVQALQEFADIRAFPIPQEVSRVRFIFDHLRSLVSRRPYTVPAYDSADFRNTLRQVLKSRRFDLVHVDSLDLSAYLQMLEPLPVVCVHHNVESALLRRMAAVQRSAVVRRYVALQARFMEQEERRYARRVALNVAVSEPDLRALVKLVPHVPAVVVPNGVDTRRFTPATEGRDGLVFVGGYDWYPNRDALEFFAAEILPLIRRRHPSIAVTWVGRAPDDVRQHYAAQHAIEMTGYVDDIRPSVSRAACFVVPLRSGGGTRLKILDAWALGKAVVSTSIGCEGLLAEDGENILIRDEPQAFADAVDAVVRDVALRTRIGAGARHTAEARYDWDSIGEAMLKHYRKLAAPQPA